MRAWGPPSGAPHPGEAVDDCAHRELCEETGIEEQPFPTGIGWGWPVYVLEVLADVQLALPAEHDRYRWVSFEEAVAQIEPAVVCDAFCAAVSWLEEREV